MINKLLLAWAALGAPLLVAVYTWGAYRYSYSVHSTPQTALPMWLPAAALVVSVGSGVLALFFLLDRMKKRKPLALTFYGIGMSLVDVVVLLFSMCLMGDCI